MVWLTGYKVSTKIVQLHLGLYPRKTVVFRMIRVRRWKSIILQFWASRNPSPVLRKRKWLWKEFFEPGMVLDDCDNSSEPTTYHDIEIPAWNEASRVRDVIIRGGKWWGQPRVVGAHNGKLKNDILKSSSDEQILSSEWTDWYCTSKFRTQLVTKGVSYRRTCLMFSWKFLEVLRRIISRRKDQKRHMRDKVDIHWIQQLYLTRSMRHEDICWTTMQSLSRTGYWSW